jgi:hypothetical protein
MDAKSYLAGGSSTAAAPSFTWAGDSNTGIFHPVSNQISFAVGASEVMAIDAAKVDIKTRVSASKYRARGNGTQANTIYGNDAGTAGMYFANNLVKFSLNSLEVGLLEVAGTGITDNNAIVTKQKGDDRYLQKSDASTTATGSTIVERTSQGYINATYFNNSHSVATRNNDTVFYTSNDDYIRKNNAGGVISSLGLNSLFQPKLKIFTTATERTFVTNKLDEIPHSLGEIPDIVYMYAICKVATQGFAVNEIVQLGTWNDGDDSQEDGVSVSYTASHIYVKMARDGVPFIISKETGGHYRLDSNWRYKIKAIVF